MASAILLVTLLFGVASCGEPDEENGKLVVAVTILPQAQFVEKIGGDKVDVLVMVPPGGDPHTYEPTPSKLVSLSNAVMYAAVGSGVDFELSWLDSLIDQNEDMQVVDCSHSIQLQEIAEGRGMLRLGDQAIIRVCGDEQ